MYRQLSECRICKNTQLVEVLDLGIQALTAGFPKRRAQEVPAGPLKLVKCTGDDVCGLLQLQHSYDPGELFGDNYCYRSGLNSNMVAHLHAQVRRILDRVTLSDDALIMDIGANDSTALQAYPAHVSSSRANVLLQWCLHLFGFGVVRTALVTMNERLPPLMSLNSSRASALRRTQSDLPPAPAGTDLHYAAGRQRAATRDARQNQRSAGVGTASKALRRPGRFRAMHHAGPV
jgi:hypothetical protein